MRKAIWLGLFVVALGLGVGGHLLWSMFYQTTPDRRPPLQFDPSQPYHLEFGRGSGLHGLDTVVTDETGRTVLHRRRSELRDDNKMWVWWETATLVLDADARQRITGAIQILGLLKMDREYHQTDFCDGTQWVFWLQQGDRRKSIYFNNYFPTAMERFAEFLDAELDRAGRETLVWHRVPDAELRKHEQAIWASIKD